MHLRDITVYSVEIKLDAGTKSEADYPKRIITPQFGEWCEKGSGWGVKMMLLGYSAWLSGSQQSHIPQTKKKAENSAYVDFTALCWSLRSLHLLNTTYLPTFYTALTKSLNKILIVIVIIISFTFLFFSCFYIIFIHSSSSTHRHSLPLTLWQSLPLPSRPLIRKTGSPTLSCSS